MPINYIPISSSELIYWAYDSYKIDEFAQVFWKQGLFQCTIKILRTYLLILRYILNISRVKMCRKCSGIEKVLLKLCSFDDIFRNYIVWDDRLKIRFGYSTEL